MDERRISRGATPALLGAIKSALGLTLAGLVWIGTDRIFVAQRGRIVAEFDAAEATEDRIMYAAIH